MVRGCLGHSDHEMTEFSILGEVRKGHQQNLYPELPESRLCAVQDTGLESPLGNSP